MKNDGLLIVNKPAGMSSGKLVSRLKRKFRWKKVGHGGTLDPFASGVMAILVGEGTKVSRFLLGGNKTYLATARIGLETETGDIEGSQLGEASDIRPSLEEWKKVVKNFIGPIQQVPPMYSALKHEGRALYKYAREGVHIDRPARTVMIDDLKILSLENDVLRFSVECGGGTYIRVLAEDLAKSLGTKCHLIELERTASKEFSINDAFDFQDLLDWPEGKEPPLKQIAEILNDIPQLECGPEDAKRIRVGDQEVIKRLFLNSRQLNTRFTSPYTLIVNPVNESSTDSVALIKRNNDNFTVGIERVFV